MEWIKVTLGFEGLFVVEAQGRSGGLALLWRWQGECCIKSFSSNHVDVEISREGEQVWRFTGLYGYPNRNLRVRTWNLLRQLARNSSLPWCVMGDLNNLLSCSEQKGGRPYPPSLLHGFQQCLVDTNLFDLDLQGHPYTWERHRGTPNWIESRLDRCLITTGWYSVFPAASLINLEFSSSDHNPLLLHPSPGQTTQYHTSFRFENAWLKEPMCMQIVKDHWADGGNLDLVQKLTRCSRSLAEWGRSITTGFGAKIKYCREELKLLKSRQDNTSVSRFKEVKNQLFHILDQKEIYWRQRSKQLWLKEGDKNSKFFHAAASTRKKKNRILSLRNDNDTWVDWNNGLEDVILGYYTNLFSAQHCSYDEILEGIQPAVTSVQNQELLQPVTAEEVKRAVFHMHPDKSPGPDGLTPAFFQKCWHIIELDVVHIVQRFILHGDLNEIINDTNIVLIPKKARPECMTDLRPIALCNVLYKIITKVLANRMKPLLDGLISPNQSAFIPGRLISDNVLVSFEVLHYLKRKRQGKTGYMALKLDMSKAYDRVEWPFLRAIMKKMGFDELFVQRVIHCVSSARYMIVHDGHQIGPIIPSRGIRQGDPLSPYLFILCAEGLSALIRRYESRGWLHGCKVAQGAPSVTHMLFADDSYLYCRATPDEANHVRELLKKFERASGQQVNLQKSSIFFSTNTDAPTKMHVMNLLQMLEADRNSLYLGLPSMMGRNKRALLGYLKEKARKRMFGWEGKLLSKAGKEVLIKTVVQSLPSFAMSVFLLPLEISRDIERLMNSFWWKGSNSSNKGIHWLAWDRLCKHKTMGGRGFRSLRDFNLAMLGKQGWRLTSHPNSLVARIFKARYYPNGSYTTASMGNNPSFVWRSIWAAQELIKNGSRWKVGSGRNIKIWEDPWLPNHLPFITSPNPGFEEATVSSLMEVSAHRWDDQILHDLFNDRDRQLIQSIPLNQSAQDDVLIWQKEVSGLYTVKSAYKLIQEQKGNWIEQEANLFWKHFWKLKVPPPPQDEGYGVACLHGVFTHSLPADFEEGRGSHSVPNVQFISRNNHSLLGLLSVGKLDME